MKTTRAGVNRTSRARPPPGKPKRPEKLPDKGSSEDEDPKTDGSGCGTENSEHVSVRRPIAFKKGKLKTSTKLKKLQAPSKSKESESSSKVPGRTRREAKPPKKAPKAKRIRREPSESAYDSGSDSDSDSDSDYASGRGKRKSKKRKGPEAKRSQKKHKRSPTPSDSELEDGSEPGTPRGPVIGSVCSDLSCKIHQIRARIIPVNEEGQDSLSGYNDADADKDEHEDESELGTPRGPVIGSVCSDLSCKIHQIRARVIPVPDADNDEDEDESVPGTPRGPVIGSVCSDLSCKIHQIRARAIPVHKEEEDQDSLADQGESHSGESDADADNDELEEAQVEDESATDGDEQDGEEGQDSVMDQGENCSGESDADADNDEPEETQAEDGSAIDGDEQDQEGGQGSVVDQGESCSGESDADADGNELEETQEENESAMDGDEQDEEEDQDGTHPTANTPSNSTLPAPLSLPPPGGSGLGESSRELGTVPDSPDAGLRHEPDQNLFDPLLKGLVTNNPIEALLDEPEGTDIVDWHLGTSHPKRCPECKFNDPRYSYRPCFHSSCRRCWYKLWEKMGEIENKEEYAGVKCQYCKRKVDYVVQTTSRSDGDTASVIVYEVPKRLGTGENGVTEVRRYRYAPF